MTENIPTFKLVLGMLFVSFCCFNTNPFTTSPDLSSIFIDRLPLYGDVLLAHLVH